MVLFVGRLNEILYEGNRMSKIKKMVRSIVLFLLLFCTFISLPVKVMAAGYILVLQNINVDKSVHAAAYELNGRLKELPFSGKYTGIEYKGNGMFICTKIGAYSALVDIKGNEIFRTNEPNTYVRRYIPEKKHILLFHYGGKNKKYYSLVNMRGKEIRRLNYSNIHKFYEGIAVVEKEIKGINGKPYTLYGYMNDEGEEIVKPKYDYATSLSRFGKNILVQINGKYGIINRKGKEIVSPKYDSLGVFSDTIVLVELGNKWGLINKNGKVILRPKYDSIGHIYNGIALVLLDNRWGIVNEEGKVIVKPKYDMISSNGKMSDESIVISEGLIRVCLNGKYGYVNEEGKVVIKPKFIYAEDFSEGLAVVRTKDGFAYINKMGEIVLRLNSGYAAGRYHEGLAPSAIIDKFDHIVKGKCGYIDKEANWIVEPKYDEVGEFEGGLARVGVNGLYGYIDKQGNEVVRPEYESEDIEFIKGYIYVRTNGKWGILDSRGNVIVSPKYNSHVNRTNAYNPKYELFDLLHDNNVALGELGGEVVYNGIYYGLINSNGNEVAPCVYQNYRYYYK